MEYIKTYELFGLFKRKLTNKYIDLVSDLFLEISDGLKEVHTDPIYKNEIDYDAKFRRAEVLLGDTFTIIPIMRTYPKSEIYSIIICIRLKAEHISSKEQLPGYISDEKRLKYEKLIDSFCKRLKKYKMNSVNVDFGKNKNQFRIVID